MSNETDLDCLARNFHVWPEDGLKPPFSKNQWLARRAELQRKPSWQSAPEWAKWLCQRDDGMWFWCIEEPRVSEDGWETRHEARSAYPFGHQTPENVLGDWRDTLERRPVDLSEAAVTERLQGAVDNVLAAVPKLKSDGFKFEPLTSIEDNQEQDMTQQEEKQQDNGWFDRGELPPVGVECEFIRCGCVSWHEMLKTGSLVKVLAHYSPCDDGFNVAVFSFDISTDGVRGSDVSQATSLCFHPILTDREKAIDEMVCEFIDHYGDPKGAERYIGIATKLYEIGYRKETK